MKKIFTLMIGVFLISAGADAQCWVSPACINEVSVNGTLSNQNYNGSICFDGSGTISSSVNVNNWDFLSYTGTITVSQIQNINSKKMYASGNITFGNISLGGTDTIFVFGNTVINGYNNNGKTIILLGDESSSVTINGTVYHPGDTLKQNSNYIAVTSCEAISLPVTLVSFTAKPNKNTVVLNWVTGTEINSQGFDIERSENDEVFAKIGSVKSKADNTGNGNLSYSYTDLSPLASDNYYRLKEIDNDGNYKYSNVIPVHVVEDSSPVIFPNPATSTLHAAGLKVGSAYRIMNITGNVVAEGNVSAEEMSWNISAYPVGIYFINITDNNGKSYSLEFIKK